MSILPKIKIGLAAAGNIFSGSKYDLTYISEGSHWIIRSIGDSLVETLNDKELLKARTSITHFGVRTSLVHFGSIHAFLTPKRINRVPGSQVIVSWYHIELNDPKVVRLAREQGSVARIHTPSNITKNQLIAAGIDEAKISLIPQAIDLAVFEPKTGESNQSLRAELHIPPDAKVIGSFQKDGVGWDEGLEPKLIKGPDIFLKVVAQLAKDNKIHVLLTGPSRGYVKKGLESLGVAYTHIPYVEDSTAIAPYYHALDLYLVASRVEGGPQAILEAWASGVPLVATRVGMVPDIAIHDKNVLMAESEDVAGLVKNCQRIFDDKTLAECLVVGGLAEVVRYDWSVMAQRYYDELYAPLL